MTHNPCRYGECCTPRLFARSETFMKDRKRDLLEIIKDAARAGHSVTLASLGWEAKDLAEALISDGLIVETADGLKPHPV